MGKLCLKQRSDIYITLLNVSDKFWSGLINDE